MLVQVVMITPSSISVVYGRGYHERIWWEEQIKPRWVIRKEYYMNLRGVGSPHGKCISRGETEYER